MPHVVMKLLFLCLGLSSAATTAPADDDPTAELASLGARCSHDVAGEIIGVDLSNAGSDMGRMAPMVDQIEQRYGRAPKEVLVDGNFVTRKDIEKVAAKEPGVEVYAPVPEPKDAARDPHQPAARNRLPLFRSRRSREPRTGLHVGNLSHAVRRDGRDDRGVHSQKCPHS